MNTVRGVNQERTEGLHWAAEKGAGVDLGGLSVQGREGFYRMVCVKAGVDPVMRPFVLLRANGRWGLCAREGVTETLGVIHGVKTEVVTGPRWVSLGGEALVHVRVRAIGADRRVEYAEAVESWESTAEAMRRCERRAKRRAVLAVLGLEVVDVMEIETLVGELVWEELPVRGRVVEECGEEMKCVETVRDAAELWLRWRDAVVKLATGDRLVVWARLCERMRELGEPEPVAKRLRERVQEREVVR